MSLELLLKGYLEFAHVASASDCGIHVHESQSWSTFPGDVGRNNLRNWSHPLNMVAMNHVKDN